MKTSQAIAEIEAAPSAAALFPDLDGAKKLYRQLAHAVHPDRVNGGDSERAGRAFARLADFYAQRTGGASTVKRIGDWSILGGLARGGLCDVFELSGRSGEEAVLKVARAPRDNGLLSQETATLKALHANLTDGFKRYVPRALGAFNIGGRRGNVVSRAEGCFTMEHIVRQFPAGLDFRHVTWMGNRLLEILGAVHRQGIVHGAVLPHHLMYRPEDHGLVLVDWTCSVTKDGGKIPLVVKRWAAHYPPEVRAGRPTPSTDLYMAAEALRFAAGGRVPRPFRAVLEWMTAESTRARPGDAWEVQDRWRAAAKEQYGRPKFIELRLPTN